MREIGRLRLKFIIYNMLVVTAVIGITFCAVTSVVKHRVNDQGSLALSRVVSGEEDMGILDAYHLRYLRISQPAGHMIAFADTTYEDSLRNGVMKYGDMACVAIWLGFFALSYFFSWWAVKPVEESVRMQKQFVADASHELKTPLTVITANAELLQERDDVLMMGNPSRMGQLIKALMDNAVKYSVPRWRAEVRLEPAGRNRARLWVCSQGEPIPEDKRTLIFRRFYRDDSARSSTNGYGLGLAIAAETARSHRARIGVEYRDGMNCFYVTVKRKRA